MLQQCRMLLSASAMGGFGDAYDPVRFLGGGIFGTALFPQTFLALRPRSTADISFRWQVVSTVGLCTLLAYCAHHSLWPVFYPMAFKLACLVYLIGLKIYYDVVLPKGGHDSPGFPEGGHGLNDTLGCPSECTLKRMAVKKSLQEFRDDMNCESPGAGWELSKAYHGAPSKVSRSRMGASVTSEVDEDHTPSKPSTFFRPALGRRQQSAGISIPRLSVGAPSNFSHSRMRASVTSEVDEDYVPSKPSTFFRPALGRQQKSTGGSIPRLFVGAPSSFSRRRMGASATSNVDEDHAPNKSSTFFRPALGRRE